MGSNSQQDDAPDQRERDRILKELDRSLLVEAAAGTGKTTMMVRRMVALLASGRAKIQNIAAITFTRKAAAEIRSRFRAKLEDEVQKAGSPERDHLGTALSNFDQCFVGTIHSFCARLLRERPVEAGVDIAFREIDDDEDSLIRRKAWDQYTAELSATNNPILKELGTYGLELKDLWYAFDRYTTFPDVEEWPIEPPEPLDLTQVRELIDEVAEEAQRITCFVQGTYTEQDDLMRRYARVGRMIRDADLDNPAEAMRVLKQLRRMSPDIEPDRWLHGQKQAKEEQAGWNEYAERARAHLKAWSRQCHPILMNTIEPAREVYDRFREELGVLNFQDLLLKSAGLLRKNPHVRLYFKTRFSHILVDEFQDTDPIQAEVMMLLTGADPFEKNWQKCKPEGGSLFVVGDPKQSIYRFRRADIVTYNKVKSILNHDGQGVVRLQANFRSSPEIINWVNKAFRAKFAGSTQENPEYVELLHGRSETQTTIVPGVIRHTIPKPLSNAENEEIIDHEAEQIAQFISWAVSSKSRMPRTPDRIARCKPQHASFDDFLIVTAKKKRLGVFVDKLQKYGIPHQVTGGDSLNQCKELQLLSICLTAVTQPDNPIALIAALRSELFGISDDALYEFKKSGGDFSFLSALPQTFNHSESGALTDAMGRLKRFYSHISTFPTIPAIEVIMADMGLPVRAALDSEGNFRAGSLMKGLELLRSAQNSFWALKDLTGYLQSLANGERQHDAIPAVEDPAPAVRVMNLHKAKGLEAPVVFLADPSGGDYEHPLTIHIDRSGDKSKGFLALYDPNQEFYPPEMAVPAQWDHWEKQEKRFKEAEDKRLMYVAATRACDRLIVVHRQSYNNRNPWKLMEKDVTELAEEFRAPAIMNADETPQTEITNDEVLCAQRVLKERWTKILAPSYSAVGVKEISVGKKTVSTPGREHGTEWGTVIHFLLETVMIDNSVNLRQVAFSALAEQGFQDLNEYLEEALQTVRSVTGSPLWARARNSLHCLVEVPFQLSMTIDNQEGPVDTILRGAIDLAFLESDGWVIADYKSDACSREQLPELVEHYREQVLTYARAWRSMTGAEVHETGLFFTHCAQYVIC